MLSNPNSSRVAVNVDMKRTFLFNLPLQQSGPTSTILLKIKGRLDLVSRMSILS